MKRSAFIACVAVIAFVSGLSVRNLLSAPVANAQPEHQDALPEFSLPDLSGKQRNIKEWQGKVLVINFWATWCPPCLKEMPEFESFNNEYAKKGVQFIGIALDELEPVKEFISNKKITYPILLGQDQGTKLAYSFGNIVNTVPFTVIVDNKGVIVKRQMGTLIKEDLLKIVTPLLHEK
jgi:thiol-disulfide isomerase/thioredoxin